MSNLYEGFYGNYDSQQPGNDTNGGLESSSFLVSSSQLFSSRSSQRPGAGPRTSSLDVVPNGPPISNADLNSNILEINDRMYLMEGYSKYKSLTSSELQRPYDAVLSTILPLVSNDEVEVEARREYDPTVEPFDPAVAKEKAKQQLCTIEAHLDKIYDISFENDCIDGISIDGDHIGNLETDAIEKEGDLNVNMVDNNNNNFFSVEPTTKDVKLNTPRMQSLMPRLGDSGTFYFLSEEEIIARQNRATKNEDEDDFSESSLEDGGFEEDKEKKKTNVPTGEIEEEHSVFCGWTTTINRSKLR